jgi:tetratricopeptide (TPR) repeat protein
MENTGKVELANRLRDSGKFQEALELFKELESDSKDDPGQTAGYLIDEADCYAQGGDSEEAKKCISKARMLVRTDPLGLAQIDFFEATLLIEDGQIELGLQALSFILSDNSLLLRSKEGRELYERIQIQRGFSLMHLSRCAEARPILEEASSFRLEDEDEVKSSIHCHLGRCYAELGQYAVAKEQFVLAQRLKVPEDWEDTFHYYYGYTLYELKEFDSARREFILSLQSGSSGPPASYKYNMLAATHRKLGEHRQARQYEDLAQLEKPQ